MARLFGGRTIELLAPAGTFEIFRDIIAAPCDAVYLGGQPLNMRMIRKGYNLSREELAEAVSMAREAGKALYVTVNSLANRDELGEAAEYLEFLASLGPSALIVQDPALISLAKRHCPDIPLHASVMMNVHSLSGVRFLESCGVRRVVLSREMPLSAVARIAAGTEVELEYFTHGDMCVANGSQCLYSSYLFGQSSNRGRCLKPCRWPFTGAAEHGFPLAVKDMNMIARLPDLLAAGVSSLKIEGRMRQGDFISSLVREYADALDGFLGDPLGWKPPDPKRMEVFRKRDWSTAYAFGVPGTQNLNSRGEGTGAFYSTGKMFSQPAEEREIPPDEGTPQGQTPSPGPALTVRVNSLAQGRLALEYRPRRIYLSAEPLLADLAPEEAENPPPPGERSVSDFTGPLLPGAAASSTPALPARGELEAFSAECREAECSLFVALPRMMSDDQTAVFREWLRSRPPVDGFLVTHAGALDWLSRSGYALAGDWTLNASNGEAARFWADAKLASLAASTELSFDHLASFPGDAPKNLETEAVLHGFIPVMYLDHDVSLRSSRRACLESDGGRLTVIRDCWNRYHLFPAKELSLLPKTASLASSGYTFLRAEIQAYPETAAREVLAACRAALADPSGGRKALESLSPLGGGFTYGAHGF